MGSVASVTAVRLPEGAAAGAATLAAASRPPVDAASGAAGAVLPPEAVRLPVPSPLLLLSLESPRSTVSCMTTHL